MFDALNNRIIQNPEFLSLIQLLLVIKFWFYLTMAAVCVYWTYIKDRREKRRSLRARKQPFRFVA